ncbi:hypothetical protein GGR48_000810 [Sphingomonas pseudosanguinis]|uniref:Uncharacterized protein n=1 Tax=Sphingomonas pseudosanguinis TaxID=413712 RepID=A0A7W6A856_9SPHN|nr:hypothetical protein [Sphingomonas pseudosanguinis]
MHGAVVTSYVMSHGGFRYGHMAMVAANGSRGIRRNRWRR